MTKKLALIITGALTLSAFTLFAEEASDASIYDNLWERAALVKNSEGSIKNMALSGRLQGDAFSFHSEDNNNDDIVWRRLRFGAKAELFNGIILHSELDLNMNNADSGNTWEDFYIRLTDTYLAWSPNKAIKLKVGKQSASFTLDGSTSSKKLLVPERSIVSENIWFRREYFTGATVSGKTGDYFYNVGGFSSSGETELGHFKSGYFALLSGGIKIGETGSLRLDYVYNDPDYTGYDENSNYIAGSANHEHVGALVFKTMFTEKIGFWGDIAGSIGIKGETYKGKTINQSDLLGVDLMPFYNISETFQLVLQYAGVTSLDNLSDVSISRYASRNMGRTRVETSHNMLFGFNWYLYGHKLKWQNAVEYNYGKNLATTGADYNGYGVTSALRISW